MYGKKSESEIKYFLRKKILNELIWEAGYKKTVRESIIET